jgi:hypothetical protein
MAIPVMTAVEAISDIYGNRLAGTACCARQNKAQEERGVACTEPFVFRWIDIPPVKRRSMKMGSHRRSVGPTAASAAPQTRGCGKRPRAPGGSSENSQF